MVSKKTTGLLIIIVITLMTAGFVLDFLDNRLSKNTGGNFINPEGVVIKDATGLIHT